MDTYELKLCGVKRELPFIDLEDNLAFASFVIMGDTELITACAPELAEKFEVSVRTIYRDYRGGQGDCPCLRNQQAAREKGIYCGKKEHQILYVRRGIGIGAFHHDLRGAASVPGRP